MEVAEDVTRGDLLRHLSSEDLKILFSLYRLTYENVELFTNVDDIKYFLFNDAKKKRLFRLAMTLMGWEDGRKPREVLDSIKELKASLNKHKPQFTERVLASNPATGEISVGVHALNRFWQYTENGFDFRRTGENITQQVIDDFRNTFAEAQEVRISKRLTLERKLNNDYRTARYFLNDKRNLRFVVSEKERFLVTVEIPITLIKQ